MKSCAAIFWIILLSIPCGFALDRSRHLSQHLMETWTSDHGLPHNTTTHVIQTNDGYIWVGTEEGLARFNGTEFTVFDKTNQPGLPDAGIRTLLETRDGTLWIGTRKGLVRYLEGRFEEVRLDGVRLDSSILSLWEDPGGILWIGTQKGLIRLRNGKQHAFSMADGLPDNTICSLCRDTRGDLWAATERGLAVLRAQQTRFESINMLNDQIVFDLQPGRDGVIWIGTRKGLYVHRSGRVMPWEGAGLEHDIIHALQEDRQGNLWIGTYGGGLKCLRGNQLAVFPPGHPLSDNLIRDVYEDREKNLWITSYRGLYLLRDGEILAYSTEEGLSNDGAFSVCEDRQGAIWAGTEAGLNRISGEGIESFDQRHGLRNTFINCSLAGRDRVMWFGSDDGLHRLEQGKFQTFHTKDGLPGGLIMALTEDRAGRIWAGTESGLAYRSGTRFVKPSFLEPEFAKTVNVMLDDSRGAFWFSIYREGLACAAGGKMKLYTIQDGLADNSVLCLYEDRERLLWIGTNSGISCFRNGQFRTVTFLQGLFHDGIFKILEDDRGRFWMSCNKGIFAVSRRELLDVMEGRRAKVNSLVLGKAEGMRSTECNGGAGNPGCRSRDGRMWFPTTRGVVVFQPDQIGIQAPVLFPVIEKVMLDGKVLPWQDKVLVQPGQNRLDIAFACLNFSAPGKIRYQFRLPDLESQWVEAGSTRGKLASYTALPPGAYTFELKVSRDGDHWTGLSRPLHLQVLKPFWRQWWFLTIFAVLFAGLSYLIIHFLNRFLAMVVFWKRQKYIAQYKLLGRLGAGGMGTVHLAHHLQDRHEVVAIKILREELFDDDIYVKRFKQEAVIVDQLDHPNIVRVIERGLDRGHYFIAMEYLPGRTLARKIIEEGRIPWPAAVQIVLQIADALKCVHDKGIVHRDIKPENIMLLNRDGNPDFVKLMDFGLAVAENQSRLTTTGTFMGSIKYVAPERLSGSECVPASDIYSTGVILYEMLTGIKPFTGETSVELIWKILGNTPPPPLDMVHHLPSRLSGLVMQMMHKQPEERPGIQTIIDSLETISYQEDHEC